MCKIYCYANFFCYANFSIVFGPHFGAKVTEGRPNCLRGHPLPLWKNPGGGVMKESFQKQLKIDSRERQNMFIGDGGREGVTIPAPSLQVLVIHQLIFKNINFFDISSLISEALILRDGSGDNCTEKVSLTA